MLAYSSRREFIGPQYLLVWIQCKCSVGERRKGGSAKAMYATVRRYEGVTDPKEVARQVEEHFLPIISEMPGFVAYSLVDAGEGVMVSTSVFEHKDAEEQTNYVAGKFVQEHLLPLLPNRPQITAGEVVAHKSTQTAESDEGVVDKAKRKLQGQ